MSLSGRMIRFGGLFLALAISTTASAQRTDVAVRVQSGRTFYGQIDARTDADDLWLRIDDDGAAIYRPIRWDRVVSADVDGEQYTCDALRRDALQLASIRVVAAKPIESSRSVWGVLADSPEPAGDSPPAQDARRPGEIKSLDADAFLANWNSTVDADGVVVEISPRDASGRPTTVSGVLEATLVGEQTVNTSIVPRSAGLVIRELGRWSTNVRADDFQQGTASYRFAFQAIHPEYQLDFGRFSVVHLRLTVPGQGVFERTVENVRIRPFSIIRDEIQRETGQRFLPHERTSRGKRSPSEQP